MVTFSCFLWPEFLTHLNGDVALRPLRVYLVHSHMWKSMFDTEKLQEPLMLASNGFEAVGMGEHNLSVLYSSLSKMWYYSGEDDMSLFFPWRDYYSEAVKITFDFVDCRI